MMEDTISLWNNVQDTISLWNNVHGQYFIWYFVWRTLFHGGHYFMLHWHAKKCIFRQWVKLVKTHTRSKNTSCKVNNYFMLAICFTQTKLTCTLINCNDEINNRSFQTI